MDIIRGDNINPEYIYKIMLKKEENPPKIAINSLNLNTDITNYFIIMTTKDVEKYLPLFEKVKNIFDKNIVSKVIKKTIPTLVHTAINVDINIKTTTIFASEFVKTDKVEKTDLSLAPKIYYRVIDVGSKCVIQNEHLINKIWNIITYEDYMDLIKNHGLNSNTIANDIAGGALYRSNNTDRDTNSGDSLRIMENIRLMSNISTPIGLLYGSILLDTDNILLEGIELINREMLLCLPENIKNYEPVELEITLTKLEGYPILSFMNYSDFNEINNYNRNNEIIENTNTTIYNIIANVKNDKTEEEIRKIFDNKYPNYHMVKANPNVDDIPRCSRCAREIIYSLILRTNIYHLDDNLNDERREAVLYMENSVRKDVYRYCLLCSKYIVHNAEIMH